MSYKEQNLIASIIDANKHKSNELFKGKLYVAIPPEDWKRIMGEVDKFKDRTEVVAIEKSCLP